jgi:hypothetical protein
MEFMIWIWNMWLRWKFGKVMIFFFNVLYFGIVSIFFFNFLYNSHLFLYFCISNLMIGSL